MAGAQDGTAAWSPLDFHEAWLTAQHSGTEVPRFSACSSLIVSCNLHTMLAALCSLRARLIAGSVPASLLNVCTRSP